MKKLFAISLVIAAFLITFYLIASSKFLCPWQGKTQSLAKNFPQMTQTLTDLAQSDPSLLVSLYEQAAERYRRIGKPEAAETLYQEALAKLGDHEILLVRVGDLARQRQDHQTAVEYFERAIGVNPQNSGSYQEASHLWEALGEMEKAEQRLRQAIDLITDAGPRQNLQNRLVQLQIKAGKKDQVMAAYRSAIEADPSDLGSYVILAQAYQADGDIEKAIQVYQEALEKFPEDTVVVQRLADFYWGKQDYENAEKMMVRLTELEPDNETHWRRLTDIYTATGQLKEASEVQKRIQGKAKNVRR